MELDDCEPLSKTSTQQFLSSARLLWTIRVQVAALFSASPIERWPSPNLGIGEKVGNRKSRYDS